MIAIAIAIIVLRITYIIHSMSASMDENVSFSAIAAKVSNHVKGLVIAVIAEAIIEVFKSYYFH